MIISGGIIGGALPSVVYAATGSATSGNPRNITGLNFGIEAPRRVLATVLGSISTGGAISAVTIGGVSATKAVGSGSGLRSTYVDIWYANVPTGTSGTVTVTQGGTWPFLFASVYALYNLKSSTPHATTADNDESLTLNLNLNTLANGIVLGGALASFLSPSTPAAATWTGITEDYDQPFGTTNRFTSASGISLTTQTPQTVTCSGMTGNYAFGCSASFR